MEAHLAYSVKTVDTDFSGVEIGTYSYGSYTMLYDENDNGFFSNIIIVHSNIPLSKNVTAPYEIGTYS